MNNKIFIHTDQISLLSKLIFEVDENVRNEIILALNDVSANIEYQSNSIIIPWIDLKGKLTFIAAKLKLTYTKLELDEFSTKLIKELILEKKIAQRGGKIRDANLVDVKSTLLKIGFKRELKLPQERDIIKLINLKNGANFSVPGAGKTTTLLALHFYLKVTGEINRLFVVSPINAFISWEDEVNEVFKESKPKIHRLSTDELENYSKLKEIEADILIVNYEKLRNQYDALILLFLEFKFHLILDESHRIKSGDKNLSFTQIRRLSNLAVRRDILSGTPVPQSVLDIYPQFEFLWPSINVIPRAQIVNNEIQNLEQISENLSSYFVRTTKNELELDTPNITYTTLRMGPLQKELYGLIRSEASRQISGMDLLNIIKFRKINKCVVRLLQASSNPMLLTSNDYYDDEVFQIAPDSKVWEILDEFNKYEKPIKLEYLLKRSNELLEESNDRKIVIWSYFVRNIKLIEHLLRKYNPVSIYGEISTGDEKDINSREGRIRRFHNDPSCRILIGNPQACGEGISLHRASHYAIYFERSFNSAHYLQSIDRIHRLGLPKGVNTNIEILQVDDSIDLAINERLNKKVILMADLLNDKHLKALVYDPQDIPKDELSGIDREDIKIIVDHITTNDEAN